MVEQTPDRPHWWGRYDFLPGHGALWQIGPLRLAVVHLEQEWQILHERCEEPHEEPRPDWSYTTIDSLPAMKAAMATRYAFHKTDPSLQLLPIMADRPVVTRPKNPLYVPAGEKITLYISLPLWMRIQISMPACTLAEIPIQRPSDTWFGKSTGEGELCYANRSRCRLHLDDLPQHAYRATTPVHIHNLSPAPLMLERLNLPASVLSVYASADHQLWTQAVTFVRSSDTDVAEVHVGPGAPPQAQSPRLLSASRQEPRKAGLVSAFNALFR